MKKFLLYVFIFTGFIMSAGAEELLTQEKISADHAAVQLNEEQKIIQEIISATPEDLLKALKNGRIRANGVYRCNTPLMVAIRSMYLGLTPQDISSLENAQKKVKILIENGADVNKEACQPLARLPLATVLAIPQDLIGLGKIAVDAVDWQINNGGDCNFEGIMSKPCKEMTPEDIKQVKTAITESFSEQNTIFQKPMMNILKLLVDNGADFDKQDVNRRTALYFAADAPAGTPTDALRFLIVRGANVNIQDIDGNTPLIIAAANKNQDAVDLLIAGGADKSIRNNLGARYNEVVGSRKYLTLDDLLKQK